MEDAFKEICGVSREDIAKHYGYTEISDMRGFWKNEPGVLQKLTHLPEVIDPKKKVRVTFDYDPHFPRALLQVTTYD